MASKHPSLKIEDLFTNNKTKDRDKWLKKEVAECEFKDERLNKRFQTLFGTLWKGLGESIPFACQDWANTKAAYRFFGCFRAFLV